MKKINLRGISRVLSEQELKNVTGGSGASGCDDGGALCSGNCMRPGGAADKCRQNNSTRKCTCGGV